MSESLKHHAVSPAQQRLGFTCGVAAYTAWALFPLYFKQLPGLSPFTILSHRVTGAILFLGLIITLTGQWPEFIKIVRHGRTRWLLCCSSLMVATNWLSFIWATTHDHVLDASLGYFTNPLVAVLLGVIVLRERLRKTQLLAVTIAALAVLAFIISVGRVPYISLAIAFTFAIYGLIRKVAVVSPIVGLFVEAMIVLPMAITLITLQIRAHQTPSHTYFILAFAGPMTAIPLILFNTAARRLPLSTIGFLQYISPTGQFLIGRFVYQEPFNQKQFICFIAIWIALAIFTVDSIRMLKSSRAVEATDAPD